MAPINNTFKHTCQVLTFLINKHTFELTFLTIQHTVVKICYYLITCTHDLTNASLVHIPRVTLAVLHHQLPGMRSWPVRHTHHPPTSLAHRTPLGSFSPAFPGTPATCTPSGRGTVRHLCVSNTSQWRNSGLLIILANFSYSKTENDVWRKKGTQEVMP